MQPILTPEAMGRADRRTIDAGTSVEALMQRAGRSVAWATRRVTSGGYGRRAVVVCGKGNNGGDGLIAARALVSWGIRTEVFRLGDGVDRVRFARALSAADVAVDAMYGTGFRGALDGDAGWVAAQLAAWPGPVVAVDIPSGVDGLTGKAAGPAVQASVTVTFQARKPGLVFEPGRTLAGLVQVSDIGIDLGPDGGSVPPMGLTEIADVVAALPARAAATHKWRAGVMVVGGSDGMTGAPMFVSHAAMRAGAGIVWCGLPGAETARRASGTEVITKALPSVADGGLAPEAAKVVLADLDRFRALAVGPGLGGGSGVGSVVCTLVADAEVPIVLDADGLQALHGDLGPLLTRRARGAASVLTPHEGEYAAVAGAPVGDDRIEAARRLAGKSGAVVLLKGPGTVVAAPDGRVAVNPTGGAALATAGTGDVLSGVIAGFLAGGADPFPAAAAAAWVHGRCADVLVEQFGHTGLVAGDLLGEIPRVVHDLEHHPDRFERP